MDDTLTRVLVVLGGAVVVGTFAGLAKRRSRRPTRAIADAGLAPGIYLLSSGGCDQCETARTRLERMVGAGRFTELIWDTDPETFHRLHVSEVPSTLVVAGDGSATWHSGVPARIPEPDNP